MKYKILIASVAMSAVTLGQSKIGTSCIAIPCSKIIKNCTFFCEKHEEMIKNYEYVTVSQMEYSVIANRIKQDKCEDYKNKLIPLIK